MAIMKPTLPDHLIQRITKLGDRTDAICETALKAGAKIAKAETQNQLEAVIGSGTKYPSKATGELERSLGTTPVRLDAKGNYDVKIGFAENRPDGKINAKIANIIEYGKTGQPAKPFLKRAKNKSKVEAMTMIQLTLEKEMNSI